MKHKKADLALGELLSRQEYLVVQGNDLAKAFGGLKSFEHSILDYCFSFVTKESKLDDVYSVSAREIINHLGLSTSGTNYARIANAFKRLNENTALYLRVKRADNTEGIRMTQLFSMIDFYADGAIKFKFSAESAPYVLDLKEKYYSFTLAELSRVKGKYALIMLKLWESYRHGKARYTNLTGSLEEWQSWFLGNDKRLPAGQFFQKVLTRAIDELTDKMPVEFYVTTQKRGRVVTGYEIQITDTKIPNPKVVEDISPDNELS